LIEAYLNRRGVHDQRIILSGRHRLLSNKYRDSINETIGLWFIAHDVARRIGHRLLVLVYNSKGRFLSLVLVLA